MKKEEKLKELREIQQRLQKEIADKWDNLKKMVNDEKCTGEVLINVKSTADSILWKAYDWAEVEKAIKMLEALEE